MLTHTATFMGIAVDIWCKFHTGNSWQFTAQYLFSSIVLKKNLHTLIYKYKKKSIFKSQQHLYSVAAIPPILQHVSLFAVAVIGFVHNLRRKRGNMNINQLLDIAIEI